MFQKNRILDKDGKTIAFEWFTNPDGPGDWRHRYVSEHQDAINSGTCPHNGKREAFTGKVGQKGVKIYAGDSLLSDGDGDRGDVFWDEQKLSWMVSWPRMTLLLSDSQGWSIEVITGGQTDEKESR